MIALAGSFWLLVGIVAGLVMGYALAWRDMP